MPFANGKTILPFAGFCGTVCKTMSFSLTASEFVCSISTTLLFELCIAQFFLYRMRYFCTLTVILFCIFTLLNTVAVVLPLIFTTVKYLLLQTRRCVHKICVKNIRIFVLYFYISDFRFAQFFCTVCAIFYLDGNLVLYFHFVKHGCGGFAVDFYNR